MLCLNGKIFLFHVVIRHITPTIIMTIDLKRTPIRIAKHQGYVELNEHKSFVKYLGLN